MKNYIDGIDWVNIEPMKYWSFTASTPTEKRKETVVNAIFSGDYIGALKVDGYYQRLIKDEDGNCFMIARSRNVNGEVVNKIEWVPQLQEWMAQLPNGTCLLCECFLPNNEGSNKITSILGCLKDKALARQQKTPLHFYIFDVMAAFGRSYKDTSFILRVKILETLSKDYPSPYIHFATYYEGEQLWEQLQNYLAQGREGMVIMRKDAKVYEKRTPARVSIKIKKELKETLDVVVMGANPPTRDYNGKEILGWRYWENTYTGEKLEGTLYKDFCDGRPISPVTKAHFYNWAGSLVVGAMKDGKAVPIGNLSGLTEEVLANWRDYVGKVAEITGMQIMETGGVRHPKFVQWRPDLTPHDTDWYRIFGGVTK